MWNRTMTVNEVVMRKHRNKQSNWRWVVTPHLSSLPSGNPRGTIPRHWPSCCWPSALFFQSPYQSAGTSTRPAAPWRSNQSSAPYRASALWGPEDGRGWTAGGRWAPWCGSRRRWTPSSWCSTWAGRCRTRGSQRWRGPGLPRPRSGTPGRHSGLF